MSSANKSVPPSLGSNTLDRDDVALAKKQLKYRKNWFAPDTVNEYERAFAQWNGSQYAFAFMGGRVALSACIYALNLKPGDEVIMPGYTCVVVPNAFKFAGVKVVYSDIELDTYGLDASKIKKKITSKTKAILLHHLYGLVCRDYEKTIRIARQHGLYVIEDCAQSTGAEFKHKKIGNLGDCAIYSTEQSKVFTTIQGGVATTNNDKLAERLKIYYDKAGYPDIDFIDKILYNVIINYYSRKDPNRAWKRKSFFKRYKGKILISTTKQEEQGKKPAHYGRKMVSAIAAIGLNQLKKVDTYNKIRRKRAKRWDGWCDNNGYKKPYVCPGSKPVFLRYPIIVEPFKKKDIAWAYYGLNVILGVWFVGHIHPTTQRVIACPNADKAVERCINFPTIW
jgi:dTDP-4-amino-4,6-dideoxygalactose transaminase